MKNKVLRRARSSQEYIDEVKHQVEQQIEKSRHSYISFNCPLPSASLSTPTPTNLSQLPNSLGNHAIPRRRLQHARPALPLLPLLPLALLLALPQRAKPFGIIGIDPPLLVIIDLRDAPAPHALAVRRVPHALALLHAAVAAAREGQQHHAEDELEREEYEVDNQEEDDHGGEGDGVVEGPGSRPPGGVRGRGSARDAGAEGGAAQGPPEDVVDVGEGGGSGGGAGRGGFLDRQAGRRAGDGEGHVRGEEHVVGLDGGADEEAGEGEDRQAQALGEVLVREGVAVVVLGQDVEEAAVDGGFGVVEFGDVGVFEPVDQHLAAQDEQERPQHLACPFGEDGEALWDDAGASEWRRRAVAA